MTRHRKSVIELVPDSQDFHALDIANRLYPNSIKYDKEGRQFNRSLPIVTRTLRKLRGIIEVKRKYLVFYADLSIVKTSNK